MNKTSGLHRLWRVSKVPMGIAVLLSLYVLIGDAMTNGEGFRWLHVSRDFLALFYLAVGVYVSVLRYLFGGWARTRLRATILGFFAGVVLSMAASYLIVFRQGGHIALGDYLMYLIVTGIFPGAAFAFRYWEPPEE